MATTCASTERLDVREPILTFQDPQQLRTALLRMTAEAFASRFLLEAIPALFANSLEGWIEWKRYLAHQLEVDPCAIRLAGSACVGYSLAPHKMLKPFHSRSDVDVAVVSQHHFDVGWRAIRRLKFSELQYAGKLRTSLDEHRTRLVYWGTIATDQILALLPYAREWALAAQTMAAVAPTTHREINFRVYRDHEALRAYQQQSLRSLQTSLRSRDQSQSPLGE